MRHDPMRGVVFSFPSGSVAWVCDLPGGFFSLNKMQPMTNHEDYLKKFFDPVNGYVGGYVFSITEESGITELKIAHGDHVFINYKAKEITPGLREIMCGNAILQLLADGLLQAEEKADEFEDSKNNS